MTEDLFEKKIKAKFDLIDKPVSASLWKKIDRQIEKPWWVLFWSRYAWPLYATLATGILAYTFYQNSMISKDLTNLNNKLSKVSTEKTLVNTVYHKDTVYLEKTIYVKNSNQESKSKSQEKALEKYINSLKNEFQEYVQSVENKYIKPSIENMDKANIEKFNEIVKAVETSNQKVIQSIEDSPKIDEKLLDSLLIPERKKLEAEPEVEKKKKFNIPKVESRLGLTSEINTENSFGIGPTFEWFMGKSLSFNIGTLFKNYPEQEYFSTKLFNLATGKDFLKLYGSEFEIPELIEDIKIKTTILELPIHLNYYYPIKKNWDLKFSYGTHLDLKTYQTLDVEVHAIGEESYTKIQNKTKNANLHNMVFGAGLQYRKNRYIFQLTPSFTYNYREVDYQKSGRAFSMNGNFFIQLNK